MEIPVTRIQFPELLLKTRDAHKLRGYFGTLFQEESVLLHNHFEDGSHRYGYPLVQYKVIQKIPYLIGINEGSALLASLFLRIKELKLEEECIPIHSKNIQMTEEKIGVQDKIISYRFETLWLGLNQQNFRKYISISTKECKNEFLRKIFIGNILSFYKSLNFFAKETIKVDLNLVEKSTLFKGKSMIGFSGSLSTNALIPEYLGIGKSVARGFGSLRRNF